MEAVDVEQPTQPSVEACQGPKAKLKYRGQVRADRDHILTDLLRWSFLEQEPVMGASVADALFPLENGIAIPPKYFDKFLGDYLGEAHRRRRANG